MPARSPLTSALRVTLTSSTFALSISHERLVEESACATLPSERSSCFYSLKSACSNVWQPGARLCSIASLIWSTWPFLISS